MFRAIVLAVALSSASPLAFAQTAPAAPTTTSAEAELQARTEAFGTQLQTMATEMQTAITNAGADTAKRTADLDAIQTRYETDLEGFISAFETLLSQQAAAAPEAERAALVAEINEAVPQLRSIPQQVRAQLESQAGAQAAPAAN